MDKNRLSVSVFHGYNSIGMKRAFQALPTVNSERPKVKCLEEGVTQAQLAQMVGTSAPYVSRLINKKEGIINKVFVDMLDNLGYDIQLVYVKKKGAAEK